MGCDNTTTHSSEERAINHAACTPLGPKSHRVGEREVQFFEQFAYLHNSRNQTFDWEIREFENEKKKKV